MNDVVQYLKRIHEAQEGGGSGSAEARARALAQDERQCRSYLTLARFAPLHLTITFLKPSSQL
jgi:hypothetical protein